MPPPIDILFFDAAFTLFEPWPGVGATYAAHAARHGANVNPAALDAGFMAAWKHARTNGAPAPTSESTARDFWRHVVAETFQTAGATIPADPYFDQVYADFATARCWRLYPETITALQLALSRGVRVGMLSNFDARLRPLVTDLGLAPYMNHLVISTEVGSEKPEPRIFEAAQELAGGTEPARIALIGDSLDEDYHGARAAGWRAALVDRRGRHKATMADCHSSLIAAVESLLA